MIPQADAIVDPRAVVVHLHDAAVADAAVVSPWGLERRRPAPPAELGGEGGLLSIRLLRAGGGATVGDIDDDDDCVEVDTAGGGGGGRRGRGRRGGGSRGRGRRRRGAAFVAVGERDRILWHCSGIGEHGLGVPDEGDGSNEKEGTRVKREEHYLGLKNRLLVA